MDQESDGREKDGSVVHDVLPSLRENAFEIQVFCACASILSFTFFENEC